MKRNLKRLCAVLLTLAMICSLQPMVTLAAEPNTFDVSTDAELTAACQAINAAPDGGEYIININADIDDCSGIYLTRSNTTIAGNGHSLNLSGGARHIYVSGTATVNLGDGNTELVIDGGKIHRNDTPGAVLVAGNDVTVNMNDKVTIQNYETSNYIGGGVTIQGGTFHMYGGTIENCGISGGSVCYGGGVAVNGVKSLFIMENGQIKNNYVETPYGYDMASNNFAPCAMSAGGGVAVLQGGKFILSGGSISNNSAENGGGGGIAVFGEQSTAKNMSSSFVMTGGTVSNNTAANYGGGMMISSACPNINAIVFDAVVVNPWTGNEFEIDMGTGEVTVTPVTPPADTDVSVDPDNGTATITPSASANGVIDILGGTISGNEVKGKNNVEYYGYNNLNTAFGGGIAAVFVRGVPVNIGAALIENNSVAAENGRGGGIGMGYGTLVNLDGTAIKDNHVSGNGGGIATVYDNGAALHMKDITVTGNSSDLIGGGIYYTKNLVQNIYISGVNTVQNNKYDGKENNLNISRNYNDTAVVPIIVEGALTGSKIGLSDPKLWNDDLTDEDKTAVSEEFLTKNFVDKSGDDIPYDVFTSDHETWYPWYGDNTVKTETTYGYPSRSTSWRGAAAQVRAYVAQSATSSSGYLYYNATTKAFNTTSGYAVYLMKGTDNEYWVTYKNGSYYYELFKTDWTSNALSSMPSISSIADEYGVNVDDSIKDKPYMRAANPSGSSTYYVYRLTENTVTTGSDNSGEVRLVRTTCTLHYNDNATEDSTSAYFPYKPETLETPERDGYCFLGWMRYVETDKDDINSEYRVYTFDKEKKEYVEITDWSGSDEKLYQFLPETKTPAENCGNVEYYAQWAKVDVEIDLDISTDISITGIGDDNALAVIDDSQKEALLKNIDLAKDIQGSNTEIKITVRVANADNQDEIDAVNDKIKSDYKNVKGQIDYSVSVEKQITVDGKEVEKYNIHKLAEPLEIVFAVPDKWQSGGTLYMLRAHSDPDTPIDIAECTDLDEDAATVTIQDGELASTYTMFYVAKQSGGGLGSVQPEIDVDIPGMLNGSSHFAYVVGYPDGNVRPNGNITRAEAATIFFRLLKDDIRDGNLTKENPFSDIDDAWYTLSISTMAKLDILKGRTEDEFVPNGNITRAEFATICVRFDKNVVEPDVNFSDIDGHWAEDAIIHAASIGWINGYPDGTFRPDEPITRAEAMTLINRVLHRIPETEKDLLAEMTTWPDNTPDMWHYIAVQEATNSHEFKYKLKINEKWTKMRENPDWTRYQN